MNLKLLLLAAFCNFFFNLKFVLVVGEVDRRKIKGGNKFKAIPAQAYTKQSVERKMVTGNAV